MYRRGLLLLAVPMLAAGLMLALLAAAVQAAAPIAGQSAPFGAYLPLAAGTGTAAEPLNCRYGTVAGGATQFNWLSALRIGWYLDFNAHAPARNVASEFVQTVRITQTMQGCAYLDGYNVKPPLTEAGLGAVVRSHPGALWIIGNEPDRGPNPDECAQRIQDDNEPHMYARGYHDIREFILQRDPTARTAMAGLVQVTPGRLQYLDQVWEAYQQLYGAPMPVDVWTMHIYILPEARADGRPNNIANIAVGTDPALAIRESGNDHTRCAQADVYCWAEHDSLEVFREQVAAMRGWMKVHGQRDKPLYLSEWSLLYPYEIDPGPPPSCFLRDEFGNCFPPERVARYLTETVAYLEGAVDADLGYPRDGNRLVQRWLWWGMYTPPNFAGGVSNLLSSNRPTATLTLIGQNYRDLIQAQPTYVNLFPHKVTHPSPVAVDGPVTVTLAVAVRNSGNAAAGPFTVIAYADAGLTKVIGSAVVTSSLGGCEQRTLDLAIPWPGVTVGTHPYWIKVDSTDVQRESDEGDNLASGEVAVFGRSLLLPLILRR